MSMIYSDNPVFDAEQHAADLNKLLDSCPVCECCGYHIQDEHLWDVDGLLYHESCAESIFRKRADAYGC